MIGTIIKGRYRIDSQIGTGGMANVYKAQDTLENRTVAIKMLKEEHRDDAEFARRFATEAQAVLTLSHPNIVGSYDVGTDENTGCAYIVLEYVQGGTLKELIKEKGPLPPKQAVGIACQILDALDHAHACGFIHRDVKPQNVMLTTGGQAKLADFGIARDAAATTRTFAGTNMIGSVHYISPEQARGELATAESDLYSCAIMLYEMLTGQVPFAGDNSVAIALKHLQEDIQPPNRINPKVSRSLSDVVVKGAVKDPARRYATARDMRADLQRALREPYGKFARLTAVVEEKKPKHMGFSLGGIALAVILLLSGFLCTFLLIQSMQDTDAASMGFMVPTLEGKTLEEARELAALRGFNVAVGDYNISEQYPAGQVISQNPVKGMAGKEGDTITVVVSSGNSVAVAPDLLGKTLEEALLMLAEADLKPGQIQYAQSDVPEGQIICQEPEATTLLEENAEVDIWISGTEALGVKMPDLTGADPDSAVESLKTSGFQRIWLHYFPAEEGMQENRVQRQSPEKDINANKAALIELWISRTNLGTCATDIAINLDIEGAEQKVVVTAVLDNGAEAVLFEEMVGAGKQKPISFTAYLRAEGSRNCIVYVGGTEVKRITATFKAKQVEE